MPSSAELRKKHPVFHYQEYSWSVEDNHLTLKFDYLMEPNLKFEHLITLKNVSQSQLQHLSSSEIEKIVFNIGLVELLSYWKAACPPLIDIQAGQLNSSQLDWWQQFLLKGMGEFFYVNQIEFTANDFVTWKNNIALKTKIPTEQAPFDQDSSHKLRPRLLIPIGGGKDSVVEIELAKKVPGLELGVLLINPPTSSRKTADLSEIESRVEIDRRLDPQLLQLNEQGYLNGHVPITGILSFIGLLAAKLYGYTQLAFANERSANQGNHQYLGEMINHQYSKSFEFEQLFRDYLKQNLTPDVEYFSFLRPLYELQIGKLFSQYDKYHPHFLSCNIGQKENRWCGQCPKCLFAYLILAPFTPLEKLNAVFGKEILKNRDLKTTALELVGAGDKKPFECVGTFEESLLAFYLIKKKIAANNQPLPYLVKVVDEQVLQNEENLDQRAKLLLNSWNEENFVPPTIANTIKESLD